MPENPGGRGTLARLGIHIPDTVRFDVGGKRGAAGPADGEAESEAEAHLLRVHERDIHQLVEVIERLYEHQRMRRLVLHSEWAYIASGSRAECGPLTQDQFRVTYVWAYCGGGVAGTLYLKGSQSNTDLALPIPANTQPPLQAVLGDGDTGGIILDPKDLRYAKTNDGSNQQLIVILAGEVLKDSHLS